MRLCNVLRQMLITLCATADFSMSMDDNLAWSEKLRGPEEDFDHHTRKPRVGSAAYETWVGVGPVHYFSQKCVGRPIYVHTITAEGATCRVRPYYYVPASRTSDSAPHAQVWQQCLLG